MSKVGKKKISKSNNSSKIDVEDSYTNYTADSSVMPDEETDCSVSEIKQYDKNNSNMDEKSEEYLKTVIFGKIMQYVKLDTILQKKQFEYKKATDDIKLMKDNLEEFLCQYLDKIGEECINFGEKKSLVKTVSQTKAPPKIEDIGICLVDGFKKHNLIENDDDVKKIVDDLITAIDNRREIKTRKYIKYVGRENPNKKEKAAQKSKK